MTTRPDQFQRRLIQTACFEGDEIGTFFGPGKQRRAAVRTELAGDLPAAVGDSRIAFDLPADDTQSGGFHDNSDSIGAARSLLAVVTVTIAGALSIAGAFILYGAA